MHLREMPVAQGLDWRATDVTTEGTSGKSSIAQMQQYFGPLRNSDIETLAADRFAHETHNLPKAYEGRNKFLMSKNRNIWNGVKCVSAKFGVDPIPA